MRSKIDPRKFLNDVGNPKAALDVKELLSKPGSGPKVSSGELVGLRFSGPEQVVTVDGEQFGKVSCNGKIVAALHYGYFLIQYDGESHKNIVCISDMVNWDFLED